MRKFCLIVAMLTLLASCSRKPETRALQHLDEMMKNSDMFCDMRDAKIDSLRFLLYGAETIELKFDLATRIEDMFAKINTDSTRYYLDMMDDFAFDSWSLGKCRISRIDFIARSGGLEEARVAFEAIDTIGFGKVLRTQYLILGNYIYGKTNAQDKVHRICKEYLSIDSLSSEADIIKYKMAMSEDREEDALQILLNSTHMHHNSRIPYHIGEIYAVRGDARRAMLYFAESAIRDIHTGNKAYMALYCLSDLMFKMKMFDRAVKCMEFTLKDRVSVGYLRSAETAVDTYETMNQIILRSEAQRRILMILFIIVLAVLLGICVRQLEINRRQTAELEEYQKKLIEEDVIKEKYLFRYMELSTQYITMCNDNRLDYLKTAKNEGIDSLIRKLRQITGHYMMIDEFFHFFDITFLDIYPEFFNNVNKLLKDGESINIGKDGTLDIRARIPALIRLGMDESGKMAKFLNCSTATIYTYRSLLRSAAKDKDNFEAMVRKC